MDSQNKIEFSFNHPHRFVKCYKKQEDSFDVYVDQLLIKTDATLEWIKMFKRLMNTRNILG